MYKLIILCTVLLSLTGFGFGQLSEADLARAAEVERLLTSYGEMVWPGWGPQALLVRGGKHEYLIGHPSPPEGFVPLAGVEIAGADVYIVEGHLTPAPIATSWHVGEVWSVAIPLLDEFQTAIDEVLGADVVVLDDPSYIRAVVHETFHAFQLNTYGGPDGLPRADETVDEREVFARLQEVDDLNDWHVRQGQALARALDSETEADVLEAVVDFLALREQWRGVAPEGTTGLERQVEWVEGMARYADTSLMMIMGKNGHVGTARLEPFPSTTEVWNEFLGQLREPPTIAGSLRDRYYVLGAAQGFVLDKLIPNWKERALPGGAVPEDLLAEAVALPLED